MTEDAYAELRSGLNQAAIMLTYLKNAVNDAALKVGTFKPTQVDVNMASLLAGLVTEAHTSLLAARVPIPEKPTTQGA